ncbi:MAG TPA: hypothetical protein ENN80_02280 [Candidatus Hydrogenedentes bacterium]|nr:hypothetical protein [Candidatus Hydrogenedentota bacterium]
MVLDEINAATTEYCDAEDLTRKTFLHFFYNWSSSRIKDFIYESGETECYPPPSVGLGDFIEMSIYRDNALPYFIVAMTPTIRIGDVYLGVDKIAHFFGFGRRYYIRYSRLRKRGLDEREAIERLVGRGILQEKMYFGRISSGIFSHADLEANYQGFCLARDLCSGEEPYIVRESARWVLSRPVDLRDYVTPDFDESYNQCAYWPWRLRKVAPVLTRQYADITMRPNVQARMARYAASPPSLSKQLIEEASKTWRRAPKRIALPVAQNAPSMHARSQDAR